MKVYRFDATAFGIMKSARTHIAAPSKNAKRSERAKLNAGRRVCGDERVAQGVWCRVCSAGRVAQGV